MVPAWAKKAKYDWAVRLQSSMSSGRILLTRRTDNGQWCLPGGRMELGESSGGGV